MLIEDENVQGPISFRESNIETIENDPHEIHVLPEEKSSMKRSGTTSRLGTYGASSMTKLEKKKSMANLHTGLHLTQLNKIATEAA